MSTNLPIDFLLEPSDTDRNNYTVINNKNDIKIIKNVHDTNQNISLNILNLDQSNKYEFTIMDRNMIVMMSGDVMANRLPELSEGIYIIKINQCIKTLYIHYTFHIEIVNVSPENYSILDTKDNIQVANYTFDVLDVELKVNNCRIIEGSNINVKINIIKLNRYDKNLVKLFHNYIAKDTTVFKLKLNDGIYKTIIQYEENSNIVYQERLIYINNRPKEDPIMNVQPAYIPEYIPPPQKINIVESKAQKTEKYIKKINIPQKDIPQKYIRKEIKNNKIVKNVINRTKKDGDKIN
jgi:hypothetical protein